jgi:hypothetical protein
MLTEINVTAEGFGAAALLFNIIAYRQDDMRRYLIFSGCSMACLSLHFYLLAAFAAAIGCGLAALRNAVALKSRASWVVVVFVSLNMSAMLIEYFVLHHGPLLFLAYASGFIFTVGSIVITQVEVMRRWFLLAEGLGCLYALIVGSIFGTIFNLVNISNILLKMRKTQKSRL